MLPSGLAAPSFRLSEAVAFFKQDKIWKQGRLEFIQPVSKCFDFHDEAGCLESTGIYLNWSLGSAFSLPGGRIPPPHGRFIEYVSYTLPGLASALKVGFICKILWALFAHTLYSVLLTVLVPLHYSLFGAEVCLAMLTCCGELCTVFLSISSSHTLCGLCCRQLGLVVLSFP